MTDPDTSRHIEIKDSDQTVASAEVTTSHDADGTARASLHAASGHIAPGSRGSLVDAVMDLPEVQQSARLKAAVRLATQNRCGVCGCGPTTRSRVRPTLPRWWRQTYPRDDEPESGQEPDGQTPVP